MAAEPSIMNRIKDMIGEFKSTIPTYHALVNDGFNFVAKAIPTNSPLWHNTDCKYETNDNAADGGRKWDFTIRNQSATGTENKKVLGVYCFYPLNDNDQSHPQWDPGELVNKASNIHDAYYVEAKNIPYKEFNIGLNPNSIYYNYYNYDNPVWCETPDGKMLLSPPLDMEVDNNGNTIYYGAIKIKYFTYFNGSNLGTTQQIQTDFGFPAEGAHAGCLKSAMNILQARISDASQEEEDSELLNILNTQYASLEAQLNAAMAILLGDTPNLGDVRE